MKKKQIKDLIISFIMALIIYGIIMFLMSAGIVDYYWSGILIMACINVILATSLNLASGYLGQLTLGHAGFMSVGAYTSALCSLYLHFPFLLSLFIAIWPLLKCDLLGIIKPLQWAKNIHSLKSELRKSPVNGQCHPQIKL